MSQRQAVVGADTFTVPTTATHDGELLARLCELPAGPWLTVVIDEIDVSTLAAWGHARLPAGMPADAVLVRRQLAATFAALGGVGGR